MLHALSRLAIRRPRTTLLLAALLALPAALGLTRLELRTDGRALVPDDSPAIRIDDEIRATFEVEEPIVVLIESEDPRGVYNPATLGTIRDLTRSLGELPGCGTVSSLATEASGRIAEHELRFIPFLEPFPESEEELVRVRDDVRALNVYDGTLVSTDECATAVYVGVPEGADRAGLVRAVRELAAEANDEPGGPDRVSVLGAPVAEVLLGVHLMRDLGLPAWATGDVEGPWRGLVLIVIAVVFLIFWRVFRSPLAALPPLIEVGVCTLMVFGVMGWCGVPVYLTTAILPIILVAMGLADEIHVFERFRQLAGERRAEGERDDTRIVERALDDKRASVMKTSFTTAAGFLSFTLSPIAAVRAFGLFAALGILLCMLWTLTVVPAMLVLLGPRRLLGRTDPSGTSRASSVVVSLVRGSAARPGRVVLAFVLAALGSVLLAARVEVQDGWISGFSASSDFRQASTAFEKRFLGMHRLLVCVDAGHEVLSGTVEPDAVSHAGIFIAPDGVDDPERLVGSRLRLMPIGPPKRERDLREWVTVIEDAERDGEHVVIRTPGAEMMRRYWGEGAMRYEVTPERMKRADVLERVGGLETMLLELSREGSTVGGVLGPVRYLSTASFMYSQKAPGSRVVPRDSVEIERLWHNYGAIRGETRLRQAVDPTYSRALVDVYLKNANFVDTGRLLERLREYEREELAPHGLSLSFSGDVATSQTLIEAVVTTQVRSVLVSLVAILLIVSFFTRSPRWGLLAVLPAALSVLFNLAAMAIFGIPLGVATSMFAAMTLGIGVDYAIHFLEWTRRERALGVEQALVSAARVTGPALLVDAMVVALGFGVLTLSQVPANARLGALLVASVVGCLAVTLTLLPAVVRWAGIPRSGAAGERAVL